MEIVEKIGIAIAGAMIAALVIYAFRVRQLYLLVPKMFGYSTLTEKGKILELRAFNRGRSMEEEVHIDMPPALSYELIASDHPDVLLQKNKLVLSRVSPQSEVSIVLMAEGAIEAESFSPTINSKTTKGKVVKKQEEVPPNAGIVVMSVGAFVLFIGLMFIIPSKWLDYQKEQKEAEKREILGRYAFLEQAGWRGLDHYIFSEARRSYSEIEFPMLFSSARRKGDNFEVQFLATNKTAAPLSVTAYFDTEKGGVSVEGKKSAFDVSVPPMQSIPLVVSTEIPRKLAAEKLFVTISFKFGEEQLWGLRFYPSLNKAANNALQGTPASGRP
ncbi:MAG: hypothetical protein A2Z03_02680 [Chloroflexi bacterium RBG_16_56_8]|nr:MAG: hypothetical protein A2Z03_02680 [Chloroflexi bacterium RBG_16_56_8]